MIHLVPDEQPRLGIDAAKETANRAYTRARAAQSGPDVAALLERHFGYVARPDGTITCACEQVIGQFGVTSNVALVDQHRAHQGQVIREAYADWLSAGDVRVREVLAEAMFGFPFETSDLETILAHRNLAETALSALADLLRGQA